MSITPITKEEVELLQQTVGNYSTAITKQTANLAGKLFATLKEDRCALPEGFDREKLEDLSIQVKSKALLALDWSDFRKFLSALSNLFSGEGAVSSAHLIYRKLDKEDMLEQLENMQENAGKLKNWAHTVSGSISEIIGNKQAYSFKELEGRIDELIPDKNFINKVGGLMVKELKAISSNQKPDEKVEDPDIEAIWQDICSKMQDVHKILQSAMDKLYDNLSDGRIGRRI